MISVSTHTDQEEVAGLFRKYDLLALPVLDTDNRLVGIVTVDDAMDVVIDEATEDITKMVPLLQVRKHILKLLRLLTPKKNPMATCTYVFINYNR
ncbi:MAG: CBS domain-containing protein [Eubacterium ventriosum]